MNCRPPLAAFAVLSLLITETDGAFASSSTQDLSTPVSVRMIAAVDPIAGGSPLRIAATTGSAVTLQLTANDLKVEQRPAIAFKPFPVVDANGKPTSADTVIQTPKSHRSYKAGEYWAQVNALEKQLNQSGVTLRESKPLQVSIAATIGDRLKSQASEFHSEVTTKAYAPLDPGQQSQRIKALRFTAPALPDLKHAFTPPVLPPNANPKSPTSQATHSAMEAEKLSPATQSEINKANASIESLALNPKTFGRPLSPLPPASDPATVPLKASESVSLPLGDKKTGGATFTVMGSIGGDAKLGPTDVSLDTSAVAEAYLFGKGGTVGSFTGSFKNNKASVMLNVLGKDYSPSQGDVDSLLQKSYDVTFFSGSLEYPVFYGVSIQIGGSASGHVGYLAQSGASYSSRGNMQVDKGYAETASENFTVEAMERVDVAFSAGLDIGIPDVADLEGNVTASMVLEQLDIEPFVNTTYDLANQYADPSSSAINNPKNITGCKMAFTFNFGINDSVDILDGNVGWNVQGCLLIVGCSQIASGTIFDYTAFKENNQLYGTKPYTVYSSTYTDLPQYGQALSKGELFSPDDSSGEPTICHQLADALK